MHPDHAARRRGRAQRAPAAHRRAPTCASRSQVEGDLLFARRLQRDRLPPPGRDDGRVRARDARRDREFIIGNSREAMLTEIAQAAEGHLASQHDGRRLRGADRAQGGADDLRRGIHVDFAGTSAHSRYGINVPFCYTDAYTAFGVNCIVAPADPEQRRLARAVTVARRKARSCNAPRPSAVTARHAIGQMLPDVMFGCLHQAMRGRRAGRGRGQPVGHAAVRRPGHRARHAASHATSRASP